MPEWEFKFLLRMYTSILCEFHTVLSPLPAYVCMLVVSSSSSSLFFAKDSGSRGDCRQPRACTGCNGATHATAPGSSPRIWLPCLSDAVCARRYVRLMPREPISAECGWFEGAKSTYESNVRSQAPRATRNSHVRDQFCQCRPYEVPHAV